MKIITTIPPHLESKVETFKQVKGISIQAFIRQALAKLPEPKAERLPPEKNGQLKQFSFWVYNSLESCREMAYRTWRGKPEILEQKLAKLQPLFERYEALREAKDVEGMERMYVEQPWSGILQR